MSTVMNGDCVTPAFGLNERAYHRFFGTPRWDWLWQRSLLKVLPVVNFSERDHAEHGGGDVCDAFASFAAARLPREGMCLVSTSGMWGGLQHVQRGFEFVRGKLYGARWSAANLAQLARRLDPDKPTVAMHVRLGDFSSGREPLEAYRGEFNVSIPLQWFIEIGTRLRQAWGDRLQFQVFSDGTPEQLAPLIKAVGPVDTSCTWPSDVSDLLAMSSADLLVCSISSYSLWAAALSKGPYLWFAPQLQVHEGSWGSIWGHEPGQGADASLTVRSLRAEMNGPSPANRCFAHWPGSELDAAMMESLEQCLSRRRRTADLVRFGVVPIRRAAQG
ncbi:hypothetical protein BurJ1DRAFT_1278 [Burkholderiales bacterium JOSHI_001]|nr:hypothetical protein BurJ1DRAFT_1278 [Burkholderiales bacterium JOSHI_001]